MQEGLAVDNSKIVPAGYPAFGKRVKLGGSASWWRIVLKDLGAKPVNSVLGESFEADMVLAGEPVQIFSYRCVECGFLEAYAPGS
jgi:hypothetical protein